MKKIAIASILTVFLAYTCAFVAGTVTAQEGWEKTVTLPSGEKILDMSGEWDDYSTFYGIFNGIAPITEILIITQEGTTFTGVKQIGSEWTPKGTETIKGELDKDGFKAVYTWVMSKDKYPSIIWEPCKWEISENGNKVVLDCGERVKRTLTRK